MSRLPPRDRLTGPDRLAGWAVVIRDVAGTQHIVDAATATAAPWPALCGRSLAVAAPRPPQRRLIAGSPACPDCWARYTAATKPPRD